MLGRQRAGGLYHSRLQPLSLTVAASITYGCSLYHSRLQEGSLGHCVWEASVALSIFLATDGQESVRGRRVLELGAGCGLAGTTPSCPALGTTALLPGASLKPQR